MEGCTLYEEEEEEEEEEGVFHPNVLKASMLFSSSMAEMSQVMYNCLPTFDLEPNGYISNTTQCILFAISYTVKQLKTMYYSLVLYFLSVETDQVGNGRNLSACKFRGAP